MPLLFQRNTLLLIVSLTVAACKGSVAVRANNVAPALSGLNPASAPMNSGDLVVTIQGRSFLPSSLVQWGSDFRPMRYVSDTQLTIAVSKSDLADAGVLNIVVVNAPPGGGPSNPALFTVTNPVAQLVQLSPASAIAGNSAFHLTVTGANFVQNSSVQWAGNNRTTTYINGGQLVADILAADIALAGASKVTVVNPSPGGGSSTPSLFPVNNPVPQAISLSPARASVGDPALTLTVNGADFLGTSTVHWAGGSCTTHYVSTNRLTAEIPADQIASAGSFKVMVLNPAPGGGTSNSQGFTVENLLPTISGLVPASVNVGDGDLVLTVSGTNFVHGSIIKSGGIALATTFVNKNQVTAKLMATAFASAASLGVTVTNDPPGGGISNTVNFVVNNLVPTTTGINPSIANVNDPALTITVTGAHFVATSQVFWDINPLVTTLVDATHLTATIPATDFLLAGSFPITVLNAPPGGGMSPSAKTFTVNNLSPVATSINPASTDFGSPDLVVTVTGKNFVGGAAGSLVHWGLGPQSPALKTNWIASTTLTATIPATDFAAVGSFPLTVTTPLPAGGTSAKLMFAVNNVAPTTPSNVILQGEPAFVTSTLTCTFTNSIDIDGDAISYLFKWTKNGVVVNGQVAKTLKGQFVKDDVIQCSLIATDSGNRSSPESAPSNSVPINDSSPNSPTGVAVVVNGGGNAFVTSTLQCNYVAPTLSDPDGDAINGYKIRWFNNGYVMSGQTGQTLPAGQFVKGDGVTCGVVAFNALDSVEALSAGLTINNSPPTAVCSPTSQFSPTGPISQQVQCTGTDADGDLLSYAMDSSSCVGSLLSIDKTTGLVTGNFGAVSCSPKVTISDTSNASGTGQFTLTLRGQDITIDPNSSACPTGTTGSFGACVLSADGTYHDIHVMNGGVLAIQSIQSNPPRGPILTAQGSVTIDSGAKISADGQGFSGVHAGTGNGPGGGQTGSGGSDAAGGGGSYGGIGGSGQGYHQCIFNNGIGQTGFSGMPYGRDAATILAPTLLGSAGGAQNTQNGGTAGQPGGGALQLVVGGTLKNDGIISANGISSSSSNQEGAGSGGSLWITAANLSGGGRYLANGGNGGPAGSGNTSAGGGGRIAIYYTSAPQSGCAMASNYASASGGVGAGCARATDGTVRFIDKTNPNPTTIDCDTTWNSPVTLNSLTIHNGATLSLGGGIQFTVNGPVTVTDKSTLQFLGTNLDFINSVPGLGATLVAQNVTVVDSASKISADAQGYSAGKGPGVGAVRLGSGSGGGGYWGAGGPGSNGATGGLPYRSSDLALGSGGGVVQVTTVSNTDQTGFFPAGIGGGAIKLVVTNTLFNAGTISANGQSIGGAGSPWVGGVMCGGGSGGSISITSGTISGSGSYQASGGNGGYHQTFVNTFTGGGGGGGRIVMSGPNGAVSMSQCSAIGGHGYQDGAPGSCLLP